MDRYIQGAAWQSQMSRFTICGEYKNDMFTKLKFVFETGRTLLDLGCDDGTDAEILIEEYGLDVIGVDVKVFPNICNI